MGGFEAMRYFADDYELGHRIAKAARAVVLSREAVRTMYPAPHLPQLLGPPGALARTVRLSGAVLRGIVVYARMPWALLCRPRRAGKMDRGVYLLAYLILRFAMAWTVGIWRRGRSPATEDIGWCRCVTRSICGLAASLVRTTSAGATSNM